MQQIMTLMPLILLIFIMYFLLIRPQKKREKAVNAMRGALKVGDNIITIGGICGKIVKTKDDTLIIQVGADKTKMEVMRWAISKVDGESPTPAKKSVPEDDEAEEAPRKVIPKKLAKVTSSTEEILEEVKEEIQVDASPEIELEADIEENKQ